MMTNADREVLRGAGPVLVPGDAGDAVARAICALNPNAMIVDQGGYRRVAAPGRCVVTRAAIEKYLGRPFQLPADLEPLMPAFQGHFTVTSEEAAWSTLQNDASAES